MKEDNKYKDEVTYCNAITDKISVSIQVGNNVKNQLPFTSPANYQPHESKIYMNNMQLQYFKDKLYEWKQSLANEILNGEHILSDQSSACFDFMNLVSIERDRSSALLFLERRLKLMKQINLALERIQKGGFGYCLETGDEIGIKRLLINSVALYTVEVQEKLELQAVQNLND